MTNRHREKFISKMLLGFILITGGVVLVLFAAFEGKDGDWLLWGIAAALVINSGLYLLFNAFVHKVKSDLIRRQKQREERKSVTAE